MPGGRTELPPVLHAVPSSSISFYQFLYTFHIALPALFSRPHCLWNSKSFICRTVVTNGEPLLYTSLNRRLVLLYVLSPRRVAPNGLRSTPGDRPLPSIATRVALRR